MKIRTKKVPATTNNITMAIVNYLLSKGHSASRVNTQGQYDVSIGRWRPSGARKGFFDISACIKDSAGVGLFIAIDIKKGSDKLSKEQLKFMKEVESSGGIAFEIGSYQEFIEWYNDFMTKVAPTPRRIWDKETCENLRQDVRRHFSEGSDLLSSDLRARIFDFLKSDN